MGHLPGQCQKIKRGGVQVRNLQLVLGGARRPVKDLRRGEEVNLKHHGRLKVVDSFMWEGRLVYTMQETEKTNPSAWAFYADEVGKC